MDIISPNEVSSLTSSLIFFSQIQTSFFLPLINHYMKLQSPWGILKCQHFELKFCLPEYFSILFTIEKEYIGNFFFWTNLNPPPGNFSKIEPPELWPNLMYDYHIYAKKWKLIFKITTMNWTHFGKRYVLTTLFFNV